MRINIVCEYADEMSVIINIIANLSENGIKNIELKQELKDDKPAKKIVVNPSIDELPPITRDVIPEPPISHGILDRFKTRGRPPKGGDE